MGCAWIGTGTGMSKNLYEDLKGSYDIQGSFYSSY